MVRARKQTAETPSDTHENDVFDQQIAARAEAMQDRPEEQIVKTREIIHSVAESTRLPYEQPSHASQPTPKQSHAAGMEKRKYTPPADPFGYENQKAGENRVELLKSEEHGAWVIRFAHNPNEDKGLDGETYSKENPHPVLKMLKDEGYRWGFDSKGMGGWGKPFTGDAYGKDHIEARRVLQQAAEMMGAPIQEQGRSA